MRRGYAVILVLIACTGCGIPASNGPVPVMASSQIVVTRWTALVEGRLVRADGCYRIVDAESNTGYTLAWPPEFEVVVGGDTLRVVGGFGKGETWEFRVGDRVSRIFSKRRGMTAQAESVTRRASGGSRIRLGKRPQVIEKIR